MRPSSLSRFATAICSGSELFVVYLGVVDLCGIVQNEISFKSEYTKCCDLSHCNMNEKERLVAFCGFLGFRLV
jgi:hypothetical protein